MEGSASLSAAVEEMLRWASQVLQHSRWATEDTTVGGAAISAGDRVTLWIATANREGAAVADPDRFDVGRSPNPHVVLGAGGPHHCLGAHLTRLKAGRLQGAWKSCRGSVWTKSPVPSKFFNGIKRRPVSMG